MTDSGFFWWILAPGPPPGSPNLPETATSAAMANRLDTAGPHLAAMADRFLPQSAPSTGHGGQVGVLPRICYVFVGGSRFARAVKHVGLDTPAPRFTAMADRLLPQSTPSVGHGGKVAVLHRIWHVFIVWPPFARAVKHINLDTSAPRFTAMAERLLPQSTPAVGNGGKIGVLHRIWHVFLA